MKKATPTSGPLTRRASIFGVVLSLMSAACVSLATPVAASTDTGASPLQLANALASDASVITGASYVTVPPQGTPNAVMTTPLAGFPKSGNSYTLLTTGNAALADQPNTSGGSGQNIAGGNVRGNTDLDVTILKIDLNVPSNANCLVGIDFRFLSDEYPEYVGTSYNDAFIAELDKSTWTTLGTLINAPDNFAFDPQGNPITINAAGVTSMSATEAAGTTYDGATPALSAATPISPGAHSLYLSIFDQGDHNLDSAVMLDNLRVGTVANVATDCKPGAKPVDPSRYVALGDSYSAGEGNPPFASGTDQPTDTKTGQEENRCHRSAAAYPVLMSGKLGVPVGKHWACAGAEIPNFYHGQWNEVAQLDRIALEGKTDPSVKLVTLTIGGNDAGFADVLGACIKAVDARIDPFHPACQKYDHDVTNAIIALGSGKQNVCNLPPLKGCGVPSLHEVYAQIMARAPQARIVVAGYPHLFPKVPPATCYVGSTAFLSQGIPLSFTKADMTWMNKMSDLLNQQIRDEVAVADPTQQRISFAPVVDAFGGHEVCSAGSKSSDADWIIGAKVDYYQSSSLVSILLANGAKPSPFSFHPKAPGQKAYCRAVRKAIGGDTTSCG
ncbi:choice-of-anchor L domain-containing protein [Arthrobacter sp. SLBN-122]|uniref:choice-of-anchor L domain-containing protein n=1 Tax=Arthrobacter sp. SLBN-122 TaxID=2768455 RepID=UPI001152AE40|nr:choice-of-anchor L domain-containing protein [Arthrobacter sp. SLBN-122]TQJ36705.1 GDSL-like lipase/acylhydrolase family protein [Arthrobacter sp. SLBN-122]